MDSPAAKLNDDVALIDEALEPFTDPEVVDRSGLRWMRRTLIERRAHIIGKIAEAERSTLTVRLRSATGRASVPLTTVTALLDALQPALLAASEDVPWPESLEDDQRRAALTLEPSDAETTDEQWQIALHRPAGPLSAQPVTDDGDRLAFDTGNVGRIVLTSGLTVHLAAAPVSADARDVTLDRHSPRAGG